MNTTPYWYDHGTGPGFPRLAGDLQVDVLIIGGGITGLTAAYLMRKEGLSVALVERDLIGRGYTGHTTAHVTYRTDTRLSKLVSDNGREAAAAAWNAGNVAIERIRENVLEMGCDCGLTEVSEHLVAAEGSNLEKETTALREDTAMAREMGFEVEFLDRSPVTGLVGIRIPNQIKIHPLQYIRALAKRSAELGAAIFEGTGVSDFVEKPRHVVANGHRISYDRVMMATHIPLQGNSSSLGAMLFQTKIYPYTTYVVGALVPEGTFGPLLWSDTADPFLYLRVDRVEGGEFAILGGEDHKTGQEPHTGGLYKRLEDALYHLAPHAKVTHHWSGQVIETADGLPFIGSNGEGQFLATGYSGNGTTFGTVAAMMARDAFTGVKNPWEKAFALDRKPFSAAGTYISENADFPYHLAKDRMTIAKGDAEHLPPGAAKILRSRGDRIAAWRDHDGTLHTMSAVCPHLGCIVAWNEAEETWDCPCHGSRFEGNGKLLAGPAEKGLEPIKS